MPSSVSICNRALSFIGAKSITSLDGDSTEAKQCKMHYEPELTGMLESRPWRFANARLPLVLLTTNDRSDEWEYAYSRPVDVARIEWVNDPEEALALKRAGRPMSAPFISAETTIYMNKEGAVIDYTKTGVDASKFPQLFADALSWAVAKAVCMPITQDVRRMRNCEEMAMRSFEKASVANLNETHDSIVYDTDVVVRAG